MRYFDHDTTASRDYGITALRLEHGSQAVDCYWVLLEKIYEDEGAINLAETNAETKSVLHILGIGFEDLKTYVLTMVELGLFEGDISCLTSERATANIDTYQKKQETARQNGKLGGRKPKQKPSRFSSGNQSRNQGACKKRKEKKGVGFDFTKPNATVLDGAGAEKTAPSTTEQEIFDEVDRLYSDSVPCPQEILDKMKGGAA